LLRLSHLLFSHFPYTTLFRSSSFPIVANLLFWIWFINFNVGIFNALPITFLDGGSWYSSVIESRTQKSKASMVKNASLLLSLVRSEEHTSELQSRFDLVCRLL